MVYGCGDRHIGHTSRPLNLIRLTYWYPHFEQIFFFFLLPSSLQQQCFHPSQSRPMPYPLETFLSKLRLFSQYVSESSMYASESKPCFSANRFKFISSIVVSIQYPLYPQVCYIKPTLVAYPSTIFPDCVSTSTNALSIEGIYQDIIHPKVHPIHLNTIWPQVLLKRIGQ